jgi:hypothetical protein
MKLKQAWDVASQLAEMRKPHHPASERHDKAIRAESATESTAESTTDRRLARALGWFSIGLGLAEVFAPRQVARLTGIESGPTLVRSFGMREISAGVGILTGRKTDRWLWARVAGDGTDLAVLAQGLSNSRRRGRAAIALAAVAGVTALDIYCARRLAR